MRPRVTPNSGKRSGFFVACLDFDAVSANAVNADIFANLRLAAWRDAIKVLALQLAALVIVSVVATVGWDAKTGWSVAAGGGVGMMSAAYMAFALLRSNTGTSARRAAVGFFVGWAIKTVMTIALLWMAFRSKAFSPPALLAGFAASFLAYWLVGTSRRVRRL